MADDNSPVRRPLEDVEGEWPTARFLPELPAPESEPRHLLAAPAPRDPAADGDGSGLALDNPGPGENGREVEPIPEVWFPSTLAQSEPVAPTQSRTSLRPLLVEILQTVLLTLIIFAAVRSVVQNFKVDGASMEPTLHSGQYLLINKLSYFYIDGFPLQVAQQLGLAQQADSVFFPFGGPQRGDIIVFRFPGGPERDFIKRVMALPGDTVQVDRGRVSVNGVTLSEDYIRAVPSYSLPLQRVPPGNYFVLGDNRPNSSDSHIWGYVPQANVIGRAWVSYWPPDEWGVVANRGLAGDSQ